jgi:hypothetical protein
MSVKTPSKQTIAQQQKWNYKFEFIHGTMIREILNG